jgi:hypothetical protein
MRGFALIVLGLALLGPARGAAQEPAPLLPPTGVTVRDTPNDAGGSLTLRWELSPSDREDDAAFAGYQILRAESPEGPFVPVGDTPARTTELVDNRELRDGARYHYQVVALRGEALAPSIIVGPAVASAQWFHTGRVNTLIAVLVLSGLIVYFIEHARRGRPIFLRKIAGLDAVERPRWAGRSSSSRASRTWTASRPWPASPSWAAWRAPPRPTARPSRSRSRARW